MMASILSDLKNTIIAGIVLAVVLVIILMGLPDAVALSDKEWWRFFFRYLHVLSGIMWIGILWYFQLCSNTEYGKHPG